MTKMLKRYTSNQIFVYQDGTRQIAAAIDTGMFVGKYFDMNTDMSAKHMSSKSFLSQPSIDDNTDINAKVESNTNSDFDVNISIHANSHSASALWWLDFFTMAGRKAENEDSMLITTCLLPSYLDSISPDADMSKARSNSKDTAVQAPLLVLIEPPRDCRRLNILREYDNENTKLHS